MATKNKASKAVAAKKAVPAKAAPKKIAKAVATKKLAPAKVVSKAKALAKATRRKAVRSKTVSKQQVASKPVAADKQPAVQKIADLQTQIEELKREAAMELKEKLTEAREAVSSLENELLSLAGKPASTKGRKRR